MLYGRHVRSANHDAATNEWVVRATNRADASEDESYRFDALVFSDKLCLLPNPYAVLSPAEWGPLALPSTLSSRGVVVLMMALDGAHHAAPLITSVRSPLKMLVHDSAKPGRQQQLTESGRAIDLWVAHSTPEYAAAHLAGDDPPGIDDEAAVLAEMQAAARAALREAAAASGDAQGCAPDDIPRVLHASIFMWDHAQPTAESRLPTTHLLDATRRAGVCGDFFAGPEGYEGAEAAALSGRRLADALMDALSSASTGGGT